MKKLETFPLDLVGDKNEDVLEYCFSSIEKGWKELYWEPMKGMLAANHSDVSWVKIVNYYRNCAYKNCNNWN